MSDTAELLNGLRTAFLNRVNRDEVLNGFWNAVGARSATATDAANYAARLGEVLSETLLEETVRSGERRAESGEGAGGGGAIRLAEALAGTDPEELLETVNGTVGQLMRQAYRMVNDAGAQAQKIADEANGLGLRAIFGQYPDERLQGLYRKIAEAAEQSQVASRQSSEESPEATGTPGGRVGAPPAGGDRKKSGGTVESWLGEPVVNNVQAFYDEHVRANAEARFHAGLGPVIVRTAAPGCCNWCASRAGVYEYESVKDKGNEVFRRHKFCRCTVTYFCDGTRTEVWGRKHWEADQKTLEQRKTYGLDSKKTLPAPSEEYVRQEEGKALANVQGNVLAEYIDHARPGIGAIVFEEDYSIENHSREIETAKLLNELFGGDITLLSESLDCSTKRADYLWQDKLWELKNTSTEKAANAAIRKAIQQIETNPGGIILNYEDNPVNMQELKKIIDLRMKWVKNIGQMDIIVIQKEKPKAVFRYYKK